MAAKDSGDEEWVLLNSNDGFSFLVKKKVAMRSGTLRSMLGEGFVEAAMKTCEIDERAVVTEKLIEYLAYKTTYENAPPKEEIPDFYERIVPEVALELLTAADYYQA
ncbi:BTB/POZ protein [Amylostereum chailletii]|nr:BTB/POZ protein [Amylostereum chailletii]